MQCVKYRIKKEKSERCEYFALRNQDKSRCDFFAFRNQEKGKLRNGKLDGGKISNV